MLNFGPYGKAIDFYKQHDFQSACEAFKEALIENPKNGDGWTGLGHCLYELNMYEASIEAYDKAIELQCQGKLSPNNGDGQRGWRVEGMLAMAGKSKALNRIGRRTEALALIEEVITTMMQINVGEPVDKQLDVLLIKCDILMGLKRHSEGLEFINYLQSLRTYPYPPLMFTKGICLREYGRFEEAIKTFKAYISWKRNESGGWNELGKTYQAAKQFENGLECIAKSIFLEQQPSVNFIAVHKGAINFFREYPYSPYLAYEAFLTLRRNYVVINRTHLPLAKLTVEQCKYMLLFEAWLVGEPSHIGKRESTKLRVFINFYMGHWGRAFRIATESLADLGAEDLYLTYYQLLSAAKLGEPIEQLIAKTDETIAKLRKRKRTSLQQWMSPDRALSEHEIHQHYYAGRIFYVLGRKDEALEQFQVVERLFMPAAYMSFWLDLELGKSPSNQKLNAILSKERTGAFFSRFKEKANISIKSPSTGAEIIQYAYYFECFDAIKHVYYSTNRKTVGIAFDNPTKLKDFWEALVLSKESIEAIIAEKIAQKHKELTEELVAERDNIYSFVAAEITNVEVSNRKLLNQRHELNLESAFEFLKKQDSATSCELMLGEMVTAWTFSKVEHYYLLANLLLLENKIDEVQKIHLEFYIAIKSYSRKKKSDELLAGLKDEFKELIASGISLLMQTLDFTNMAVNLLLKPFLKGSLSELIVNWIKKERPDFKSYDAFKQGVYDFIATEKERLGDSFELRYPLYGFDDWFTQK